MQIYALKMFNFMRFGEENNCLLFDLSEDEKNNLDKKPLDELYDEFSKDPINKISQIKSNGINKLIFISGIIGNNNKRSNGAGKSTILEALVYALFEMSTRKNVNTNKIEKAGLSVVTNFNGEYPKNLSESYVELFFEENNKLYRVKRGRKFTKNQKSNSPFLEFECIDNNSSLSGHRKMDTDDEIKKIIGIEYDIFLSSILFAQGDQGKFINSTDKIKKEMLIEVLHLQNIVGGCIDKIRDVKNSKAKEVDSLKEKIEALGYEKEKHSSVQDLNDKIKISENQIKDINSSNDKLNDELVKIQKNDIFNKKTELDNKIIELNEEIKKIENRKKSEIETWKNLYNESCSTISVKNEDIKKKNNNISEIKLKIDKKQKEIELIDIDKLKEQLVLIKKYKNVQKKYEEKQEECLLKNNELRVAIGGINNNISNFKGQIEPLQEQIKNVKGDTFICDKCKSNVSRKHIENEILKLEENIKLENEKLSLKNKELEENNSEYKTVKERISIIYEWMAKEPKINSDIKNKEDSIGVVESLKQQMKQYLEDIDVLNKDIEKLELKKKEYYNNGIVIKEKYKNEIEETNNKIKLLNESLSGLKDKFNNIKNEIDKIKSNILNNQNIISSENSKIGSYKKEIEVINTMVSQINKYKEDSSTKEKELNRFLVLEDIFGLDGLQTRIINKYIGLLNTYINQMLDVLSDGEIMLEFFINDKSKVDMKIIGGTSSSFEMLSGGEKNIIRLSASLALGMLSFVRSSKKPEMIALDEIFGSLDEERKISVFNLLENLKGQFQRILLISHMQDINESIKNQIIVEKDIGLMGLSKIKKIV